MGDFPVKDSANPNPQEKNYADYCDALSAERWLRLLDETRKKRVGSPIAPLDGERDGSERVAPILRRGLPR